MALKRDHQYQTLLVLLIQDPYDLVMETCRVKKKHSWSHKDIIKLAHVKSSDKAVAVILMAIVQGLAKTVEMYKENPEAQPIL